MTGNQDLKKVAIILGFYNGNKYLIDQLNSIISQSHKSTQIFIFNDKSSEKLNRINSNLIKKFSSIFTTINRKKSWICTEFFIWFKGSSNFDYYAF